MSASYAMTTDWAATGAMLQGLGTVFGAGAVLVAAWFGKSTFEAWRKQEIAGRRLAQAERILEATYKARRALSYIRGPLMLGHELSAAEEMLKDKDFWQDATDAKRKRMVTAQGIFNRFKRYEGEQEALDQCLPMARALFGEELENAVETLRRQFWMVHVDVESYVDDDGSDKDFTRKIRQGMYEIKAPEGEVNEITNTIETSVAAIEKHCVPVLRS